MHLQGASHRKGILLLFNTPSNGLYEKRITMINVSHEDVLQSLVMKKEKCCKIKQKVFLML